MSSIPKSNKAIEVLRWIGVLPAAVLGGYVGQFVVAITLGAAIRLAEHGGLIALSPTSLILLTTLIVQFPTRVGFVIAGATMAPRYRGLTALVLALAGILLSLTTHIVMQAVAGHQLGLANYAHAGGDFLGAIVGVASIFPNKAFR